MRFHTRQHSLAPLLSKHLSLSSSLLAGLPHGLQRIITKRHQPSRHISILPILAGLVLLTRNIPFVRSQTDTTIRSNSISEQPPSSFGYPSIRRNTVAVVTTANVTAPPPSAHLSYRNRVESTVPFLARQAPSSEQKGSMSKVVRSVKNVTKGYSTVQVKVRNGRWYLGSQFARCADSICSHFK